VDVLVERAPAADTYELRREVLRPHQTIEQMVTPSDEDAGTAYYVARDAGSGAVVSTASVRPESAPWQPEPGAPGGPGAAGGASAGQAWRLRGMATSESARGQGLGGLVLDATVVHVAAAGGGLLWCSARIRAVPFYERAGFTQLGPVFEEPDIGPHVHMWRAVEAEEGQPE
jgi:predicted GNAT family N-acyltransferase